MLRTLETAAPIGHSAPAAHHSRAAATVWLLALALGTVAACGTVDVAPTAKDDAGGNGASDVGGAAGGAGGAAGEMSGAGAAGHAGASGTAGTTGGAGDGMPALAGSSGSSGGSGGSGIAAGILAEGTYKIIGRLTGLALDVYSYGSADGSRVDQWNYNAGESQLWKVTRLGGDVFQIIGVQSGKALEVASTSTADGVAVDIRTYSGSANQKWNISATSGGFYRLTPSSTPGSCLAVSGASLMSGAALYQWSWLGDESQQWAFLRP